MIFEIIAAIVVGLLLVQIWRTLTGKRTSGDLFELRKTFLTPAELSFFGALSVAVDGEFIVFSKVRVADVLRPKRGQDRSRWQSAFNKISGKHFDFVLCDPDSLEVGHVVELNDKSHRRKDRVARDEFLRAACKSADLSLIEFQAKRGYVIDEIKAAIAEENQLRRQSVGK